MKNIRRAPLLGKLNLFSITLLLGLSAIAGNATPALAQGRLDFRPTSTGAPGNREAGANRSGACARDDQGLVALMPQNNLARTSAAHPAVYAYIPASTAQFGEFVLYEEGTDELVYGTLFNVTGRSGLISIDIPDSASVASLRTGQRYYWYLSLICSVGDRAQDMTVQGSLERVNGGETVRRAQSAAVSQQPFIYAEAGLWPETLASLLQGGAVDRTSAEQNLKDLLESVGLDQLANSSLLP